MRTILKQIRNNGLVGAAGYLAPILWDKITGNWEVKKKYIDRRKSVFQHGDIEYLKKTLLMLDRIDVNMGLPEGSSIYEKMYQEQYGACEKILIHRIAAYSYGEATAALSRAWAAGMAKERVEDSVVKDVIMPVWELIGKDKKVDGYCNQALWDCLARNYDVINWRNKGLWEYIFSRHPEKIEFAEEENFDFPLVGKCHDFIEFTDEEQKKISAFCREIGLNGAPFVSVSARDSGYYKTVWPDYDISYWDFRNSDINALDGAATYLRSCGIVPIRAGKFSGVEYKNKDCIDYATNYQTDLLDIFLAKNSKFVVGCCSGVVNFPQTLGRPCVTHNSVIMISCYLGYSEQDLFIPKLVVGRSGEVCSFTQSLDLFLDSLETNPNGKPGEPYYRKHGYRFVDNTGEEIAEVVEEMNRRLDGTWVETEEDRALKERYHQVRERWLEKHPKFRWRFYYAECGAAFLRNHQDMLR